MFSLNTEVTWSTVSAKTRLSALIERAQHAPQLITSHGKPSVVVVSVEEWQRKSQRKGSLLDFLRASPLSNQSLDLQRVQDGAREIDL